MHNKECRRGRGHDSLIVHTSVLNDDDIAACGLLGIFMTRKVLGSLAEVSPDSTKPKKMIAEQENNFWKDYEKRYSSKKFLEGHF